MKVQTNIEKENSHARALSLTDRAKFQKQYGAILCFVSTQLSSIQIPLQRRNRHWLKQKDEVIIAVHVLGKLLGFTSERI